MPKCTWEGPHYCECHDKLAGTQERLDFVLKMLDDGYRVPDISIAFVDKYGPENERKL